MAKKVEGYIKLQIPAGKATPAPPVGPALGQHGVNIVEFTKQFNVMSLLFQLIGTGKRRIIVRKAEEIIG